ncbi:MAG: hypothetical protein RI995_1011 [Bacteroidota bacterium]
MNHTNRKGFWEILYMIWMGVIPLTSSIILGYIGLNCISGIRQYNLQELLLFWTGSIFVLGLGFFPTTFFALFSGYMWGIKAILPIYVVYLLASLLGYYVAKLMKGDGFLAFLKSHAKVDAVLGNVQRNSIYWVFLVRLSPVFPFAITNTLLAYLKVNVKSFVIGGTLGMIPRSILALWIGSQAATWEVLLKNPDKIGIENIASLALLIVSGLGMFYLIQKKRIIPPNP